MNAIPPPPSDDGREAADAPGGGPAVGAGGGPAVRAGGGPAVDAGGGLGAGAPGERLKSPSPPPEDDPSAHHPTPIDLSSESVAGEEDPGAGLDMAIEPDEPPGKPRTQAARDRAS